MLLHRRLVLSDMEAVDTEFYNSIKYILENDPEPLCLTFTANREFLGQVCGGGMWEGSVVCVLVCVCVGGGGVWNLKISMASHLNAKTVYITSCTCRPVFQ